MSAVEDFLAMLAAERGAAANTLSAYRRDLESAQAAIGDLAAADGAALGRLGTVWADLAPSSVARKASPQGWRAVQARKRAVASGETRL